LADYVPFYFTPFSVMMKNIHSGWGVQQRQNEEIVILVSSLHRIRELDLPFVFTNAHAYRFRNSSAMTSKEAKTRKSLPT
jgi:hypothetical protein